MKSPQNSPFHAYLSQDLDKYEAGALTTMLCLGTNL